MTAKRAGRKTTGEAQHDAEELRLLRTVATEAEVWRRTLIEPRPGERAVVDAALAWVLTPDSLDADDALVVAATALRAHRVKKGT